MVRHVEGLAKLRSLVQAGESRGPPDRRHVPEVGDRRSVHEREVLLGRSLDSSAQFFVVSFSSPSCPRANPTWGGKPPFRKGKWEWYLAEAAEVADARGRT